MSYFSFQCSMIGIIKAVVCVILSVVAVIVIVLTVTASFVIIVIVLYKHQKLWYVLSCL